MAAPADIRQINRRNVLMTLMRLGTATRSDLARVTKLSQPTMGKIVDDLLEEGTLTPLPMNQEPVARMGRPGFDVTLNRSTPCFLAVQIGPAHTRLARLTAAPPMEDAWDRTIVTPDNCGGWLKGLIRAAKPLLTPSIRAVVVSVPGIVDEVTGRSMLSPNLRWLEGQNVVALLQDAFDLPTLAVQEIRCLALGQLAFEPSVQSFLLVDFGIGVGSAPVIAGRLLEGQLPLSGELGHTPVSGNRRRCGCGGTGCLETLISRKTFVRAQARAARKKPPSAVKPVLEATGRAIAGALNVIGLDRVIITGYMAELSKPYHQFLHSKIEAASLAGRLGGVHFSAAPRRRLAGLSSVGIDRFLAPINS